jgi:hypothetical protein
MAYATDRQRRERRDAIIACVFWTALVLALASLGAAWLLRTSIYRISWGYPLVAAWVAIPPVYFLLEYVLLPPSAGFEDERVRHMHDLGRNIWLALVVLLANLLNITWPGS